MNISSNNTPERECLKEAFIKTMPEQNCGLARKQKAPPAGISTCGALREYLVCCEMPWRLTYSGDYSPAAGSL